MSTRRTDPGGGPGALRPLGDRSGQALVEFALIVPLLLLIAVGVAEFGRAWNLQQVITGAAREGARTAVVADPAISEDSVYATVRAALGRAGLDAATATISLTGWRAGRGTPASVDIEFPYEFFFLRRLADWTDAEALVTLRTSFTMRNE